MDSSWSAAIICVVGYFGNYKVVGTIIVRYKMIREMNLQPELVRAFEELGFSSLTDIQKKAIPIILQGKDVLGQSQTGSGKTAAFGFPIINKVVRGQGLQALILVPTRELCEQVTTEMRKFAKHKRMDIVQVYGGVSIGPQISNLAHADIVVATPGRMLDHMERRTVNLNKVKIFVLDEADKMFEMGFIDDVKRIASQIPNDRQTLLFSATISQEVHDIARQHMKNPEKIKVQSYVEKGKLAQYFYSVPSRDKFSLLVHIIKEENPKLAMIFCATRNRVDIISKNLYKQGISAQALHGGLSQNRRKYAIDMFHSNKIDILVASDVASRGLDIKDLNLIINYDIPKTSKEYIHRIGRTARAGKEGKVISLLSEQDHDNFRNVMDDRSLVIEQIKLPEFQRVTFFAQERRQGFGNRGFGRGGGQRHGDRYSGPSRHAGTGSFHRHSDRRSHQDGAREEGKTERGSNFGEKSHSQRRPHYSGGRRGPQRRFR